VCGAVGCSGSSLAVGDERLLLRLLLLFL